MDLSCVTLVDLDAMVKLEIAQNERLIDFEWNKSVIPQFNTQNFNSSTEICFRPI